MARTRRRHRLRRLLSRRCRDSCSSSRRRVFLQRMRSGGCRSNAYRRALRSIIPLSWQERDRHDRPQHGVATRESTAPPQRRFYSINYFGVGPPTETADAFTVGDTHALRHGRRLDGLRHDKRVLIGIEEKYISHCVTDKPARRVDGTRTATHGRHCFMEPVGTLAAIDHPRSPSTLTPLGDWRCCSCRHSLSVSRSV